MAKINSEELTSKLEYYNKVMCEFSRDDIDRMTLLEKLFRGFCMDLISVMYEQNNYVKELEYKGSQYKK